MQKGFRIQLSVIDWVIISLSTNGVGGDDGETVVVVGGVGGGADPLGVGSSPACPEEQWWSRWEGGGAVVGARTGATASRATAAGETGMETKYVVRCQ